MRNYSFGSGMPTFNGMPMVGGLPVTFGNTGGGGAGKYYFVNPTTGNDGNKGTSMDKPLSTIARAYALSTSNNHDMIVLSATSGHTLADQISVSNNRTHFWGLDAVGRYSGARSRVSLTVPTTGSAIACIVNTGVGNSFSRIKFSNSDTLSTSLYAFAEGGEYTVLEYCEFYESDDVAVTGASELVMNGDNCYVHHCWIGDSSNKKTGAIHANVLLTSGTAATGKVCRDTVFEDCILSKYAEDNTDCFVYAAADADVVRMLLFKNCLFFASPLSDNAPDVAVHGAAAFTNGSIVLMNSYEIGCDALATQTGIFSLNATLAAGGGSGIQAT